MPVTGKDTRVIVSAKNFRNSANPNRKERRARKLPPKNDLELALDEFDKENPEVAKAYEDGMSRILGKEPGK